MQSSAFSVAVYPPKAISQKAISLSKTLTKRGSLFTLDGVNYFPHITVYHTQFPLRNIVKVKQLLRQFAAKTKSFRASSLWYRQVEDGYIDVSYRRTKTFKALQRNVIKLLNPLREGVIRPIDKKLLSQFSKSERNNIRRYGYRRVGRNFFPHLTFTKFLHHQNDAFFWLKHQDFSFDVNKIGLFGLGDHGTCRKLIETFTLEGKRAWSNCTKSLRPLEKCINTGSYLGLEW